MDAAGELAQLGQRGRQPRGELVDLRVLQPRLEHPQVQRERDELLLRAVVQVALDPPPRRVARLDDPQPRQPQLLHARLQVGLQALVVDRQRGGRRGRHHQLRRGVQRGVVDDRREPPAVALDRGPRAARSRAAGSSTGRPVLVDEALAVGQPVGDRDGAVAEALGEHLPHRPARRRARDEQRVRADRAQHAVERLQRGEGERGARAARARSSTSAEPGAERPRADVVDVRRRPPSPSDAELQQQREHEHRGERDEQQRRRPAAAAASGGRDPPQRAVGEQVERAPEPRPPAPATADGIGGHLRVQPAVGGAPVEPHRARGRTPPRRAAAAARCRRR